MKTFRVVAGILMMMLIGSLQAQNQEILHKYSILKGDAIRIADEEGTKKISGSPYLEEEFKDGYIYFKDHQPLEASLRYDIVKEEMQLLLDGRKQYQVLQDEVDVSIDGVSFLKLNYRGEDGANLLGYFEVVTAQPEGKPLILLNKHYKSIKTGTRSEARGFPPKYVDKSDHYLKFNNSKFAVPVESRLEKFLAAFPSERRAELRSFIEKNNLKTRKAEDLQQIVAYYNQVVQ